jgi:pyridoxal phosphate enzyme (YggS family)
MDTYTGERIKQNLLDVLDRIDRAADASEWDPEEIKLVVVTKGHPVSALRSVIRAGAKVIGENYVQEAVEKIHTLSNFHEIEWHMIGHIQSRKSRDVVQNFDYIQSVDRMKIVRRINQAAIAAGRNIPVLIEFNVSGEDSKFGFPAWNQGNWSELVDVLSLLVDMKGITVRGLMTMPPFFDQPDLVRQFFKKLRTLREYLRIKIPEIGWDELSMGMSGDFEAAIQEGATIVRVGTAIMGPRQ